MFSPAATAVRVLGLDCTHEELCSSLLKMICGSPVPCNVIAEVNPFLCKPSNLHEGWYFIRSEENKETNHFGFWKAKGVKACKIYSNSSITGWRTTYEFYEGHVQEFKTDWVMQEYQIGQGETLNEGSVAQGSLCRLFSGNDQSQNCARQQKPAGTDIAGENRIHPTKSVVADNFTAKGSTSKPNASADDNMSRLPLADLFPDQLSENQTDYPSRDDGLGLWELEDNPASSSSSENSGCTSMSSDAYFDTDAFLNLLKDPVENQDDVDFKWSVFASVQTDEGFISLPTSGSLVMSGRNISAPKEIIKPGSSICKSAARGHVLDANNLKHASRNPRTNIRNEGPSSSSHNVSQSSDSHTAAPNGKAAVAKKKKFKKFLCFFM